MDRCERAASTEFDSHLQLIAATQLRKGDVAFGISTSGRSPNVLAALTAAKARGMTTIALTGRDGGPIGAAADIHVNVAEASTPRVQEVHRTAIHAMCSLVEQNLKS